MLSSETPRITAAYYSVWKVGLAELFCLSLAILPILPDAKSRVTYMKGLYDFPLSVLIFLACGIMAVMFLCYLPIFIRSLLNKPAFWVNGDTAYFYIISRRSVARSDIQSIKTPESGFLAIALVHGKNLNVPIFLYRNPDADAKCISAFANSPRNCRSEISSPSSP